MNVNPAQTDGQSVSRIRRMAGRPVALVNAPYRRWLEARRQGRLLSQLQAEIRANAAADLKDFHDAIWARWDSRRIQTLLRKEEADE